MEIEDFPTEGENPKSKPDVFDVKQEPILPEEDQPRVYVKEELKIEDAVLDLETLEFKCNICVAKFTEKASLDQHLIKYHQNEGVKLLSSTGNVEVFGSRERYHLTMEETVPSSERILESLEARCSKFFESEDALREHSKLHSDEKFFECTDSLCKKTFKRKCDLTNHMKIHSVERPFPYSQCYKYYESEDSVESHMLVRAKDKLLHDQDLQLTVPREGSVNNSQNSTSKRNEENDSRELQGEGHSSIGTSSNTKEYSDPKIKSREKKASPKKKPVPRNTDKFDGVKTVHAVDDRGRKFKCPQTECPKSFKSRLTLRQHVKTHSGHKAFQCQHAGCSKAFFRNYDLKMHEIIHSDERKFKCSEPGCTRSFKRKDVLLGHMIMHSDEKPFECSAIGCKRTFKRKPDLLSHLRTHSQERPYSCDLCGKSFGLRACLKKHMLMHARNTKNSADTKSSPWGDNLDQNMGLNSDEGSHHNNFDVGGGPSSTSITPCTNECGDSLENHRVKEESIDIKEWSIVQDYRIFTSASPTKNDGQDGLQESHGEAPSIDSPSNTEQHIDPLKEPHEEREFPEKQQTYVGENVPINTNFKAEPSQLPENAENLNEVETVQAVDSQENAFKCPQPQCPKSFRNKPLLRQHIKTHSGHNAFKCQYTGCTKTFRTKRNLKLHETVHSKERAFNCPEPGCPSSFKTKNAMRNHISLHSQERKFKCFYPGCTSTFKKKWGLEVHRNVHSSISTFSNTEECTGDPILEPSEKEPNFSTSPCSDGSNFKVKSQELPPNTENLDEIEAVQVVDDLEKTSSETMFQRSQSGHKAFKCPHAGCSWSFNRKDQLKYHEAIHRDEKTLKCPEPGCSTSFKRKPDLRQHMSAHRSDKEKFICEEIGCQKSFKWKISLIRHMAKHKCDAILDGSEILPHTTGFLNDSVGASSGTNENLVESRQDVDPSSIGTSSYANEFGDPLDGHREKEESIDVKEWSIEQDYQMATSVLPMGINEENDLQEPQGEGPSSTGTSTNTKEYNDPMIKSREKKASPKKEPVQGRNTDKFDGAQTAQAVDNRERNFKCPQTGCSRSFKRKYTLLQHIKNHSGHKAFQCQQAGCPRAFFRKQDLKLHEIVHNDERKFKCPEPGCTSSFKRKDVLLGHMVMHSDKKPFECSNKRCKRTFKRKNEMLVHQRIHSEDRPFSCDLCGRSFKLNSCLRTHMSVHAKNSKKSADTKSSTWGDNLDQSMGLNSDDGSHHNNFDAGGGPSSISITPYTDECGDSLENHRVKEESIDIKEWSIVQDYRIFTSASPTKNSEQNDLQESHGEQPSAICTSLKTEDSSEPMDEPREKDQFSEENQTPDEQIETVVDSHGQRRFKCPLAGCTTSYKTKPHLRVHIRSHSGHKPFKCQYSGCKWSFFTKCKLRYHEATHFTHCPEPACTYTFVGKRQLVEHMRLNHPDKLLKCEHPGCDWKFITKNELNLHKITHNEVKPFRCEQCPKTFKRKNELSQHKWFHYQGERLKCNHEGCFSTFKHRINLIRHQSAHSEVRPYQCKEPGCSKGFKRKHGLNQHMAAHRGDVSSFHCEEIGCTQSFKFLVSLNRHMEMHKRKKALLAFEYTPSSIANENCAKSSQNMESSSVGASSCTDEFGDSCENQESAKCEQWSIEQDSRNLTDASAVESKAENDSQKPQGEGPSSTGTSTNTKEYNDPMIKSREKKASPKGRNTDKFDGVQTAQAVDDRERTFKCPHTGCSRSFKGKHTLLQHIKKHSGHKPFKCQHAGCPRAFFRKQDLKLHEIVHSDERKFKCSEPGCTRSFKRKDVLLGHMVMHSDKKPFECSNIRCKRTFKRKNEMLEHMRIHSQERPYSCDLCGKSFKVNSCLRTHMSVHAKNSKNSANTNSSNRGDKLDQNIGINSDVGSHHNNFVVGEGPSSTSITPYINECGDSLENHRVKEESIDIKEWSIVQDYRIFTSASPTKNNVENDLQESHGEEPSTIGASLKTEDSSQPMDEPRENDQFSEENQTPDEQIETVVDSHGQRRFKCPQAGCTSSYKTKPHLRVHIRSHSGHKPFKCQYSGCKWSFFTKCKLRYHEATHVCPETSCTYTFEGKRQLVEHMRLNHPEKLLKCEHPGCTWKFITKNELNLHKITHNKVKPFRCEQCPKTFKRKLDLSHHKWSHYNGERLKCNHEGCFSTFKHRINLIRHQSTHSEVRPYQCKEPGCSKGFKRKHGLNQHMSAHRGDVVSFHCEEIGCTQSFKFLVSLNRHMEMHKRKKALLAFEYTPSPIANENCAESRQDIESSSVGASSCTKEFGDALGEHCEKQESAKCEQWSIEQDSRNLTDAPVVESSAENDLQKPQGEGPSSIATASNTKDNNEPMNEPGEKETFSEEQKLTTCDDINIESKKLPSNTEKLDNVGTAEGAVSKEKRFNCPETGCPKSYRHKCNLRVHILSHSGHKPYKCQHVGCKWSFFTKRKLQLHEATHSKEKKFKCPVPECTKSYKRQTGLSQHMSVHHGDRRSFLDIDPSSINTRDNEESIGIKEWSIVQDCQMATSALPMRSNEENDLQDPQGEGPSTIDTSSTTKEHRVPLDEPRKNSQNSEENQTSPEQKKPAQPVRRKERKYKCPQTNCPNYYKGISDIRKHLKSHPGPKPLNCQHDNCQRSFWFKSDLKLHESVHNNERNFMCPEPECLKAFKTKTAMREHHKLHTEEKKFVCSKSSCNRSFVKKYELVRHLGSHDDVVLEEKPFKCFKRDCFEYFASRFLRRVHLKSHSGHKTYKCPHAECPKSFWAKSGLKLHEVVHSTERIYKCREPGCMKDFKRRDVLREHLKIHSDILEFKCQVCAKSFRRRQPWLAHMRLHGSLDDLFPCEHPGCLSRFKSTKELKLHQIAHCQERTVQCEVPGCLKLFKTKMALKQHMNSHRSEGERLKCKREGCLKTFKYRNNLRLHLKRHESDDALEKIGEVLPRNAIFLTDSLDTFRSADENCMEGVQEIDPPSIISILPNISEDSDPLDTLTE